MPKMLEQKKQAKRLDPPGYWTHANVLLLRGIQETESCMP